MRPFNPKPRPCPVCEKPYVPARPMQAVCGPRCAAAKVKRDKAEERARVKTRKEAIKTLPVLKAEAQAAFNAYIRARDAGKPCISCGAPLEGNGVGGHFDCGHFRSVGSAPQHRYNPLNAAGQCKSCNRWGAGMAVEYRKGLIERIGLEAVEALENDNATHRWTREELAAIRDGFKARLKGMNRTIERLCA